MLDEREHVVLFSGDDLGDEECEGDCDPVEVPTEMCDVCDAIVWVDELCAEIEDDEEPDEPPGGRHEDSEDDEESEAFDPCSGEEDEKGTRNRGNCA